MRVPFAAWVALAGLAAVALLLALVPLTGPDRGLRIEAAVTPSSPVTSPEASSQPQAGLFTLNRIREHLLDQPPGEEVRVDARTSEVLLYCSECIRLSTSLEISGEPFQIALISEPGSDSVISAAVVGRRSGEPVLRLIVSGHELSLTPGRGGTLVAQESQYGPADQACCPSGWSVQVYRYRNGRFEAGQQISQAGTG
jgi:hypothetical protein